MTSLFSCLMAMAIDPPIAIALAAAAATRAGSAESVERGELLMVTNSACSLAVALRGMSTEPKRTAAQAAELSAFEASSRGVSCCPRGTAPSVRSSICIWRRCPRCEMDASEDAAGGGPCVCFGRHCAPPPLEQSSEEENPILKKMGGHKHGRLWGFEEGSMP